MVISALIKKLEELKEKAGDVEVLSWVKEESPAHTAVYVVNGAEVGTVHAPAVFGSPAKAYLTVLLLASKQDTSRYESRKQ